MCSQSVSVDVGVVMPEITIENIKHSNEMIMLYTGLTDFKTFQALFDTLMEHGADKLCTESVGELNIASLWRKRKFLLVLMRSMLRLLVRDLEFCFKISSSTVSKMFNSWILFMCECMQSIITLPDLNVL